MRTVRRRHPVRRAPRRVRVAPHVRTNLKLWERQSEAYDRRHARVLGGRTAKAWGFWRVPESQLRLLGPIRGRTTLELGCGAGRWSIALSAAGARTVGLDLSPAQLAKARRLGRAATRPLSWTRGNAEELPFRADVFDVVFSDWGALTFCDPHRTVPEASRVLRAGGRLVFATSSPFRIVAHDRRADRLGRTLRRAYFGMHRVSYPRPLEVNFQLTYGEWIRLFRASGFVVESLTELPAPREARSSYLSPADEAWGRRWPLESIWCLVKSGGPGSAVPKAPRVPVLRATTRSRPGRADVGAA